MSPIFRVHIKKGTFRAYFDGLKPLLLTWLN